MVVFLIDRHVVLPRELAKQVPKSHLMSEDEWRRLGVQQSLGWVHYMIHEPGITCFSMLDPLHLVLTLEVQFLVGLKGSTIEVQA